MRTPGKKTTLILLAALVALVIAGCGGGGGETETTAATTTEEPKKLSKAELIKQGDAICAEVNAAVGALGSEPEESAVPEAIEKTSNLYLGMVERLQELGTPEGSDASYAGFMEAAEELAKVEGEVKLAAEREDTEALGEAATEATPALEEFEEQAETYGFEDCSKGPGEVTPAGGSTGTEAGGEEAAPELEEGGVEPEAEFVEPETEEPAPEEEVAPETGGAGGGSEAPEPAPETGGESGGVGPG
ncbi:MAG TPA: hypothetical protein VFP21_10005 [Solirubrobacterales bacterium]|nr:hypothetical protein [Solirubrobacterales bacterium]